MGSSRSKFWWFYSFPTVFLTLYLPRNISQLIYHEDVDHQLCQGQRHFKSFCHFYDLPTWSNGRVEDCGLRGPRFKFCTQQYVFFKKRGFQWLKVLRFSLDSSEDLYGFLFFSSQGSLEVTWFLNFLKGFLRFSLSFLRGSIGPLVSWVLLGFLKHEKMRIQSCSYQTTNTSGKFLNEIYISHFLCVMADMAWKLTRKYARAWNDDAALQSFIICAVLAVGIDVDVFFQRGGVKKTP